MDRTSAPNFATNGAGNRVFQDRNLSTGVAGTSLMAADQTAHQEEIMAVIEAAGLAGNASALNQMLQALRLLFLPLSFASTVPPAFPAGLLSDNGYQPFPNGLILQWGYQAVTNGTFNFPTAFPSLCAVFLAGNANAQGDQVDNAFGYPVNNSQFFLATKAGTPVHTTSAYPCFWGAIGY